ncbi:GNAT family N-acetyltransferase [Alkalilimnicola sp. S0819]|uniref:GNAT family N-acetyltransferase n=1 Tax=Alkalilimnicola sp. S0819 TaxID=2613922 RepID=UPI001262166A|nr:GNAT family N-acetyltransferase [Alkalilimnicola sp. S0819]KAB7619488.1 GNAT family N-acetyltransferase [Alkalilimnicola sp. S0819]MPQ17686.1 GNAT family N-acetyltransferase [Alkalilimnicola sp. S0819]
MLYIREQSESDRDEVLALLNAATADLRRVYRPKEAAGRAVAATEDTEFTGALVAISEGRVIGTVEYIGCPAVVLVRGLAVHPALRRRGVARQLMAAIEEIAIARRKQRLTLDTIKETGNPKVFEQFGFVTYHEAPADRFEGLEGQQVTQTSMQRVLV